MGLTGLGMKSVVGSSSHIFWSAVIGGWIIALMAWTVTASHWTIGQVMVTWMLTVVVGMGHFAHCIATSGEILSAVFTGQVACILWSLALIRDAGKHRWWRDSCDAIEFRPGQGRGVKQMRLPGKKTLLWGAAGTAALGTLASAGAVVAAGALVRRVRMAEMSGKVVLITGASRGLGFAIAREFASLGSKVAICAREQEGLDRAAAEIGKLGAEVLTIVCDVANPEQVAEMVQHIHSRFGQIDVLVNNAGNISVGPIESQTIEDFREAMDVMFWGQVNTILAVLPEMQRRRSGWIANVSSIGGKISVPRLVPYSCAKFASVGLSEGLTAELAKDGIKVTTIVPGLMRTGSHVNAFFKGDHKAEYSWFSLAATNPLSSISARRAARSIVRAIRRGQAELILSLPAKLAAAVHGLLPGTTANLMGMMNRVLPGTGDDGKERYRGRESESAVSRSPLTALGQRASREYLQQPVR